MAMTLFGYSVSPLRYGGFKVSQPLTRDDAMELIEKVKKRWPTASCELNQVFAEYTFPANHGYPDQREPDRMIVKTYPKDEFWLTIWNIGEEDEK